MAARCELIGSVGELYARAIAMEREAAARYALLAEAMLALGNEALARIFDCLSQWEAEHLDALLERTEGMALPELPAPASREAPGIPTLSPRQALGLALAAESQAYAFFEMVSMTTDNPIVRALATEMALEEDGHRELIEKLLTDSA